jgi:hypothetical protein
MGTFRRFAAAVSLAFAWGCAGSPGAPTAAPEAPVLRLGGGDVQAGSGVSAQTLDGSFRIKPEPNANGLIVVAVGETVIVNANDDRAANPSETLHLIVNWGDGPNERVSCGPCRLEHAYTKGGLYLMEATIDDGKPGSASAATTVSKRYRVEVRGAGADFGAAPERVAPGDSTTLSWDIQDVESVTIDNGVGTFPSTGSTVVSPAATTTYTLTAVGPSGTTRLRVTVIVSLILAHVLDPKTIGVGETARYYIEIAPGSFGVVNLCNPAIAELTAILPPPPGTISLLGELTGRGPGTCNITANITGPGGTFIETLTLTVRN